MQGSQQLGVGTEEPKTQDQNMGSNQVGLGPVIWSKKSCRHLHVVSCQGGAVRCHITHGERGWETTGGEDKKVSVGRSGSVD